MKSLTIELVFDEFAALDDGERADGDDVEGQGHVGDREAAQDVVHGAADVDAEKSSVQTVERNNKTKDAFLALSCDKKREPTSYKNKQTIS